MLLWNGIVYTSDCTILRYTTLCCITWRMLSDMLWYRTVQKTRIYDVMMSYVVLYHAIFDLISQYIRSFNLHDTISTYNILVCCILFFGIML